VLFDLATEDTIMTPDEVGVREGGQVTPRLTSEELVEVHLRGYALEKAVSPVEPITLSFEFDLTGRFGTEDHESEDASRARR
jgi:hypothetical protein